MITPGSRYMQLSRRAEFYLKWKDSQTFEWCLTWNNTIRSASILEPRWIKGRLCWLLQWKGGSDRWLVEIYNNGEPDLHLLQAMTAAQWVEKHRKKT